MGLVGRLWPVFSDDRALARVLWPATTNRPPPLHNVPVATNPPIRRLKTYTGAQGYVYQYYFVGKRAALADDPEAPATEFVFDVTSDRKLTYAVSVFLPEAARDAWSQHTAAR